MIIMNCLSMSAEDDGTLFTYTKYADTINIACCCSQTLLIYKQIQKNCINGQTPIAWLPCTLAYIHNAYFCMNKYHLLTYLRRKDHN